jgi:hypothetical protein
MTDILLAVAQALGLALRIAFGLILIIAALGKIRDLSGFSATVASYRLLPSAVAPIFAYSLPAIELGLGASATFGFSVTTTVPMVAGLMLLFATAMAINLRRGRTRIDCGCGFSGSGQRISWGLVLRNLLLVAIAPLALLSPADSEGFALMNCVAAGALLAVLFTLSGPLIELASRPRRRQPAAWIPQ